MSEGRTLPPFPVNEETTTALRHALATSIGYDDAGNRIKEGGDFTLLELLDFYSGSDETRATYVGTGELIPGVEAPIYEMWDQHYSPEDVIRHYLTHWRPDENPTRDHPHVRRQASTSRT